MGRMKELFIEEQQRIRDFESQTLDDSYCYEEWCKLQQEYAEQQALAEINPAELHDNNDAKEA